ncbi:exopolysaccharide biosynthesis protein [Marinobacter daepoensis]|uniref:Exopolysaccharide biosynthesis protein n=1 Tax=Marinobacter daepoensis TaxID=262077 RepID=A0ABS3BG43_9GAMM|nr:exopolysaccharide biosynthesis protein [Marinobacter daepoensis]MBN7770467.1 exopolysaccharide biosynthesis protein [Marinobacter daepoensis]MBY6033999.1 exopolysaccharide biosynthesis protein [Marinobacter daepoensis]MBY6079913.1 exopolysaccharide biosynthesis protein [Marinobacter daepoensis]
MNQPDDPESLTELISRIRATTRDQDRVSVGDLMAAVGERSFGPLVLLAGLITVAPLIGDIPGVPTILGLLVLLTLGQLLCQRRSIWIPRRMAERGVAKEKLLTGLRWADKPAAWIDRWTKRRFSWLVTGLGQYLMALVCMAVAAAMPLMELIPFSANGGGLSLMAFGLAIVARDGLLALLAVAATCGTGWVVLTNLPW